MDDRDDHQHHGAFAQVIQDVHDADPPGFPVGADIDHDGGGHAVAQVDADDDGIDRLEGQESAGGERLQDTDGRGGTLEYKGHARAGEVAQERIVSQAGEHPFHHAGLPQGVHGAGHVQQAGKQDAEADGDIPDGPGVLQDPGHDQENADNQGDGGEGGGLEEAQHGRFRTVQVQQPDDLAGDRGTYVRADDDAEGLAQGQDARADQAGRDDDGRCGGLDQGCDRDAEDKGLQRAVGDLLHHELQRA